MRTAVPFKLNKTSRKTFTEQVVAGVRSGISKGFWRPGQTLPTRQTFVRELGVSGNTVQRAMSHLAAEGLIVSRPRIGCVVQRTVERKIRKSVLEVSAGNDCSFAHVRFLQALQEYLALANVQCTAATLPRKKSGCFNYAFLDDALDRNTPDLIVANVGGLEVEPLAKRLDALSVPYIMTSAAPKIPARHPKLLSTVPPSDIAAILKPFVDDCVAARIRSVLLVVWSKLQALNPQTQLEKAGIYVETLPLSIDESCENYDNLFSVVGAAFRKRLEQGPMCDLVFSADDYLTAGLLPVLLESGLRIPEDVKLVTFRNKGGGPAFTKSFASFEYDPVAVGRKTAEDILSWFKTGKMALTKKSSVYVRGETFPVAGAAGGVKKV